MQAKLDKKNAKMQAKLNKKNARKQAKMDKKSTKKAKSKKNVENNLVEASEVENKE